MSKLPTKMQTLKELVEHAKGVGIPPDEVRQIRKVVKEHHFPPDVQAVELDFGRDWAGGPAAWILYFVEDDFNPSKEKITRLNSFADSVRAELLKTHPSYWPYIDFRAIP
jgi:hypothetical protein